MIPLFHDFRDERVVIFGGGSVAARKVGLFEDEAEVTVVSASFDPSIEESDCSLIRGEIDVETAASLVEDAFLVIPATDDRSLNDRIEDVARDAGCLVNRVDVAGDTVTPSIVEGSSLSIAISTGGESPAVCKYLRQRLEREVERVDPMVDLQATLRSELDERDGEDRRDVLWAVLEDERVWEALDAGNEELAEDLAREHV